MAAPVSWRTVLDDLIKRGLRPPKFLIVDGAPGLDKAIAARWDGVPVQRCTVHKHRNLPAHTAVLLTELRADYRAQMASDRRGAVPASPLAIPANSAPDCVNSASLTRQTRTLARYA
jgi:hypothetical protein